MIKLKEYYSYYKKFCDQVDAGEWSFDKSCSTRDSINGENKVYTIENTVTGQELWIPNGYVFLSDYKYERYDMQNIDVFGFFKLAAWLKVKPIIVKVKKHNAKIKKLKKQRDVNEKENAVKGIMGRGY